jgi:hypothetical protein
MAAHGNPHKETDVQCAPLDKRCCLHVLSRPAMIADRVLQCKHSNVKCKNEIRNH